MLPGGAQPSAGPAKPPLLRAAASGGGGEGGGLDDERAAAAVTVEAGPFGDGGARAGGFGPAVLAAMEQPGDTIGGDHGVFRPPEFVFARTAYPIRSAMQPTIFLIVW